MVRKNGKCGVSSGNTLRASNSKYRRLYGNHSYLVRNLINSDSVDTVLDHLAISSDGVEYSLNKKGRWVVPELLKQRIISGVEKCESDVKLKLIECHKIKRAAKCVGFYASKGPIQKVLPRKKTYFDVESVMNAKKVGKSRKKKGKRVNFNPNDVENISPELKVEVFYPSPADSSITHNPKYIKNWNSKKGSQKETVQTENGHGKRNRIRKCKSVKYIACADDYDDDEEGDIETENFFPRDTATSESKMSSNVQLGDIIYHASKLQKLCEPDRNNSQESRNKTNLNTKHAETDSDLRDCDSLREDTKCEMLPVFILLPTVDILPQNLREIYGDAYMECDCFPRKFIIDITDRITPFAKESVHGKTQKYDPAACLIFEYDMNAELDDPKANVYKVYLNLKSKLNSVRIDTITDFEQTTVDDVIQRATFFIETLPPDCFHVHVKKTSVNIKDVKLQTLNVSLSNNSETYFPSRQLLYKEMFRKQKDVIGPDNLSVLGFECVPPETCYICFESIGTSDRPATALQACGHWFCDPCWHGHLHSRINSGTVNILCPEYKCKAKVDDATLLSLINVHDVERLAKWKHDTDVDTYKETKWCPNPACGRVLKVANVTQKSKNLSINCVCGRTVCFDCLQPAHWPASCDVTANYWSNLQDNKLKDVKPNEYVSSRFTVRGKHCPTCSRFISKLGGCNQMECLCGTEFCWACLRLLNNQNNRLLNNHSPETCRAVDDDKGRGIKKIHLRSFIHDGVLYSTKYSELYKMAVKYRTNRNPWKTQTMKSNIWILSAHLKILSRQKNAGKMAENRERISETNMEENIENIPAFLKSMMDLYMEINYVMEYTSVYLMEDGQSKKSEVLPILERMSYLSDSIFDIFNNDLNQNITHVIPNLLEVKQHSKFCIDGLVRHVKISDKPTSDDVTLPITESYIRVTESSIRVTSSDVCDYSSSEPEDEIENLVDDFVLL